MVLNRFCKLVGSLYLILFWCPLLWAWIYANLFGHDLYNAIGMSREEIRRFSPSTLSDTYLSISFWLFLLVTLALAVWCFFPSNWLERLIRWLSSGAPCSSIRRAMTCRTLSALILRSELTTGNRAIANQSLLLLWEICDLGNDLVVVANH